MANSTDFMIASILTKGLLHICTTLALFFYEKEMAEFFSKNDVVFEFRNERLLQGRDKLKVTQKSKANKALSAVFKMLNQNLSLDNKNLNLKSSGKISLENRYFDLLYN